jgi:hypothetical protein
MHRKNDDKLESLQYGEIVDVNLVRDKKTGKSMGFAFGEQASIFL